MAATIMTFLLHTAVWAMVGSGFLNGMADGRAYLLAHAVVCTHGETRAGSEI